MVEDILNNKKILTQDDVKEFYNYYNALKEGDEKNLLRNQFATKYLPMVTSFVNKQYGFLINEREDLIQEGFLGLLTAVDKYDIEKGSKFSNFSFGYIDGFIKRYLDKNNMIHLPNLMISQFYKVQKCIEKYRETHNGEFPSDEYIVRKTGVDHDKLPTIKDAEKYFPVSLNVTVNAEDQSTLEEFIQDKRQNVEDEIVNQEYSKQLIKTVKSVLNEREYMVIKRYFGLEGEKPISLTKIGEEFQVPISKQRVLQIEKEALRKLGMNRDMKKLNV